MKQYEIRWADLPDPIGRRPVLLLTRTPAYSYLAKVVVAEVTSTIREIPQEVRIGKHEGLRHNSVANLDNIHVIPTDHMGQLSFENAASSIDRDDMEAAAAAIRRALA